MNKKPIYLKVKDHSVSGEEFQLLLNEELDMLETFPQPPHENISRYYKSDAYISHTNSKRNIFERIYHFVRRITTNQKVKLIDSLETKDRTLLDIGCGTGVFLMRANQQGWNISGIEPNVNARDIANIKTNNRVFNSDHLTKFQKSSFDVITLWHVFEHLPNLQEQIETLKFLLKPEGRLIIAVPNYKSFDANYYKMYWAAFDVPRHFWHFSSRSIKLLFESKNFIIEKTLPLKYDAYYVSLLSEKYKVGWMNIFSAFFVATRSNLKARGSGEYSSLIYVLKNQ